MSHVLQNKDTFTGEFPFNLRRHHLQEFKQSLHAHEYLQIVYVLSGVCNHRIRGKSLTVSKGDIFLIAPGISHGLSSIDDKEFELILLDFLPHLAQDQLKSLTKPLYWLHIDQQKQLLMEQLLQDIQEEIEEAQEGYEYSIRINLIKILLMIERQFQRTRQPDEPSVLMRNSYQPIEAVVRFIQGNYSQDIPLEQGAQLANMSPVYFCHKFKKETGRTFVEYVQEVRIQRATELILLGELTITDICFQVGFQHLSHFTRTFKKWTGLTPTEYRKAFGII